MKIVKVNHFKMAVGKNDKKRGGFLYKHPGCQIVSFSEHIQKLNESRKRLYNIFTPIQPGIPPTNPKEKPQWENWNEEQQKEAIATYDIKLNNYNRRVVCSEAVGTLNKAAKYILFNVEYINHKPKTSLKSFDNDDVLSSITRFYNKNWPNEETIKDTITLALRNSLRDITDDVIVFFCNIGRQSISECDKKQIRNFYDLFVYDYSRNEKQAKAKSGKKSSKNPNALLEGSIANQNLPIQPSDKKVFTIPKPAAIPEGREEEDDKSQKYKVKEKEGIRKFLSDYAVLDQKLRMDQLRRLRRIIDLYFHAPENYQKGDRADIPKEVDESDFNVWEKHTTGKAAKGSFVEFAYGSNANSEKSKGSEDDSVSQKPEAAFGSKANTAIDNVVKKKSIESLKKRIKDRNKNCYRYAEAAIAQELKIANKENRETLFFKDNNINIFWIRHISKAVERIYAKRLAENTYKLQLSYLCEKVWKDVLNYISIKYIATGKYVFNFGMEELYKKNQDVSLGKLNADVDIEVGINSFDLEMIKAQETLQRELAVHVAFATNNLARATVQFPEESEVKNYMSDFLLWNYKDIINYAQYSEPEDELKAILQFFGGQSLWGDFNFNANTKAKYKPVYKFLDDLRKLVYALRNESFHFTSAVDEKPDWDTDRIGRMFQKEVERTIRLERDRFYSNNLPMFYDAANLDKALTALYKENTVRATQVPSFGNVFTRKDFPDVLANMLKIKIPSTEPKEIEQWQSACYYLLKEIYYNVFIQSDYGKAFFDIMMTMLCGKGNKKSQLNEDETRIVSQITAEWNDNAFKNFNARYKGIKDNTLAEICQTFMTDYNQQNNQIRTVKTGADVFMDPEKYKHNKVLLYKVLRGAFCLWFMQNDGNDTDAKVFQFIFNPIKRDLPSREEFLPNWSCEKYNNLISQVKDNAELQKWYITGRLMNTRSLNLLLGSVRSYVQYTSNIISRTENTKNILHVTNTFSKEMMSDVIQVLEVCCVLNSTFSAEISDYFKDNDEYANYLAQYVDYKTDDNKAGASFDALKYLCYDCRKNHPIDIYMDAENAKPNRNILMAKLYGPDRILSATVPHVTVDDINAYYNAAVKITNYRTKGIAENQKEQEDIIQYQRLKNHVELRNLTEYAEVLNELHGQLINWSFLRERDLLYFQLGFHYTCLHNDSKKPVSYVKMTRPIKEKIGKKTEEREVYIHGAILRQICGMYINGIGIIAKNKIEQTEEMNIFGGAGAKINAFEKYCGQAYDSEKDSRFYDAGLELFENVHEHDNMVNVRNTIDHFKCYNSSSSQENLESVLDLYSEIFDRFFSYDMKYQKNVINMLYNILLKHQVIYKHCITEGTKCYGKTTKTRAQLGVDALESDVFKYKIKNLTDEKFVTAAKDERYLQTIASLLYYPYDVPKIRYTIPKNTTKKNKKLRGTGKKPYGNNSNNKFYNGNKAYNNGQKSGNYQGNNNKGNNKG